MGVSDSSVLIFFIDGIGLGPNHRMNPFVSARMPVLREILGGPLVADRPLSRPGLCFVEADATLGVAGLPQSATGQTTLFTGVNAARRLERHVAAFPGPRLKAILESDCILGRARRQGCEVAFANTFSHETLAALKVGKRRISATVFLAMAAGARLRTVSDLVSGKSVSWDLERDVFATYAREDIPPIDASEAGGHLADLAAAHDLTLFETFLTDLSGHRRGNLAPEAVLARLDSFLGGLIARLPPTVTLVLCSDHGNIEETDHRRHTRNPVPVVALGPSAPCFADVCSLKDVTPAVLAALGVSM